MATETPIPDVYGFLDYRAYLEAWFQSKKAANPRYSHRLFARRAGQKSPSLLLAVIKGRRNLTPQTMEAFIGAMGLTGEAAAHFRGLVELDQAATDEERNAAWARISATRRFRRARRVEGDSFAYLSHWYVPAVRELALRPDFEEDPAWVAKQIRPAITVAQARDALGILRSLGMLVDGDDGEPVAADGSVVTPREVTGLAVHNYHRGMIDRAREAIDTFAPSERHLLGVTVSIPASLVPTLKEELNRMQARLLDLCDSTESERDEVVQLNLHLFPLSARREEA